MNASAASWLASRTPPPPPPLLEALAGDLAAAPVDVPLPALLAEAALAALGDALEIGDERAAAWRLLAADALLTYAIEAAAEQGMETVQAVVDAWSAPAIARVLEREGA